MNRGFFFILFLLFQSQTFANDSLAFEPAWLKLGHYHKTFGGRYESESLQSPFFLAENGRVNPEAEWQATLEAMQLPVEDKTKNEHALCKFPARALFFSSLYPAIKENLSKIDCSEYLAFKQRLQAKSVSLVFSSYYLNTPASAFGHTLMRFIKNPDVAQSERYELLDYAINYAAVVTTQNSFLYGFLGLVGGFRGEFASMPYFYKIREYNDFESRDIWDYELNLNEEQLEMLIAHTWEMKLVHFPYYYLTKNCSYHMLALLDAVHPDWKLTERTPRFVIPVDTIKVIADTPGLLKNVHFRPSKKRVLDHRIDSLTGKEARSVLKAVKQKNPESLITKSKSKRDAILLDAAIDSIDFFHAEKVLLEDPEVMEWKRKFLIARAKVDSPSPELNVPTPTEERPDISHGSRRISASRGNNKVSEAFTTIEYRAALHELIDPSLGQNPGASMEMGRIRLRYNDQMESKHKSSRLWLDDLTLVEVQSLSPLSNFYKNLSWKIYVGAQTLKDDGCFACLAPQFRGAAGYTFGLIDKVFVSFFIHSGVEQHKRLSKSSFRGAAGPEAQLIWKSKNLLNISLFGKMSYYTFVENVKDHGEWGARGKQQLFENVTLDLEYISRETGSESSFGLSYYY